MASRALAALSAAALLASSVADQASLDCPLRQIGVDYAQKLQPFRPLSAFQQLADAYNGAEEAQNCSVAPNPALPHSSSNGGSNVLSFPLPTIGKLVYVSVVGGSDVTGDGSVSAPFASLHAAVAAVRSSRTAAGYASPDAIARSAPLVTVVMRGGVYHMASTLQLTRADSHLHVQAYPGEDVVISGATALPPNIAWTSVTPPARPLWEYRAGSLSPGFDAVPMGMYTVAAAQALCVATPTCLGISFNSSDPSPSGTLAISFKYNTFYVPGSSASTWILNRGYLPNAANLWKADLTGFPVETVDGDITALRVNGVRGVRARYPNAPYAELLGAMQIIAEHWTAQSEAPVANYTFSPATPVRNDSIDDGNGEPYFSRFKLGVGGACASRFTPQAAYWCAADTQGGGPGPYEAPVGMTVTTASSSLPHTPYSGDVSHAVVHSWRAGRWFSWAFGVGSATFNAATNETVFNFTRGGNQGSRGGNAGQEFFIEGVLDELDNPAEFYFDVATSQLYLWYNASAGTPPPAGGVSIPTLPVIINATGTQAAPVVNVGFLGVTFVDSAPFFMGPHGTPSGGDWAVERSGALFFEGVAGVNLQGNVFSRLDANAVFISGYARNVTISQNEFVWIGESAVSQWGYTDGSPVPGMGFDATAGNQPRGTVVSYNIMHEVGIWTKQNSFYFQSESFNNVIQGNIAYNGPRAGFNLDDGMGGGSVITNNIIMNACRESSDHGPINSWNRQVYLVDVDEGQPPTVFKKNDTISYNMILANYHSSMAVDNDDGSSFFDTHHNVLISASQGAAYGGNSLKSDFGGHSNFHHDNLDLFWGVGFGICKQLDGYADGYYNNVLYLGSDGNYGNGQTCSGAGQTIVGNNTVWSPTGAVTECGMTLAKWQAQGGDPGTVAAAYPADDVVLAVARNLLGL